MVIVERPLVIGVLGLQGAVQEHLTALGELNVQAIIVKHPDQLERIDGLILPGGESTTMRKLIDHYGFLEPLKQFSHSQKPMFGTCAGLVLMAKSLTDSSDTHLGIMDIEVKRNAFGRQRESFETSLFVNGIDEPIPAVFIRAPSIDLAGPNVNVLAEYAGKPVVAIQNHMLVCAFHPELTENRQLFTLFIDLVKKFRKNDQYQ